MIYNEKTTTRQPSKNLEKAARNTFQIYSPQNVARDCKQKEAKNKYQPFVSSRGMDGYAVRMYVAFDEGHF